MISVKNVREWMAVAIGLSAPQPALSRCLTEDA